MLRKRFFIAGIGAMVALRLLASPAQAQENTPPPTTAKDAPIGNLQALTKPVSALSIDQRPVREVTSLLTKRSGILVLADSTIATKPISFRVDALPVTDLANGIARLLPGTTVRLIAVAKDNPAPNPDLLSQIVTLEDALQGMKALTMPAKGAVPVAFDSILISGRSVPLAKAEPVLEALNLRPALLLANPSADNLVGKSARLQAESLQAYLAMTPEQRVQATEQQMDSLLNMDSGARRALFGQMQQQGMAVMKKINSLPADQRSQLFRDLTGDKFDGTTPPAASPKGQP